MQRTSFSPVVINLYDKNNAKLQRLLRNPLKNCKELILNMKVEGVK